MTTNDHTRDHHAENSPRRGNRLPIVEGYFVDVRLREFRRAALETGLECIPFESPEGNRLLNAWLHADPTGLLGELKRAGLLSEG